MRPGAGPVAFGAHALDRRAEVRDRPGALAGVLGDARVRFVLVCGDAVVVVREPAGLHVTVDHAHARALGADESVAVLLGFGSHDVPWVAAPVRVTADEARARGLELVGLRALLAEPHLAPPLMGVVAEARSLVDWHARHGFCATCGARTESAVAGHRRDCTGCKAHHFPRVDPVAIMLVIDGERCLLGRQPRFPVGMFTCLAGFVEPGETFEDAVRREVREESGVHVGDVAYHASQPWPFPSSLMLGAYAEATSRDVVVDRVELEDCRWFERTEVGSMASKAHPGGLTLPVPGTLSRRLIDDWLATTDPRHLV